jgi:hypothetical protein
MPTQLATDSVRTYRLDPEGFIAARNKLLRQRIVLYAGILLFILLVLYKSFGQHWRGASFGSVLPVLLSILIIFGALVAGVRKGIRQNLESWNSFELLIGRDFLVRRIEGLPELEIQKHEVTAIKETTAGLRVETTQRDRAIGIASSLVDYADAKARLSRWLVPVQERQRWMSPARWSSLVGLLVVVLFACIFYSDTSWIIVAAGVPLFTGLCACIWLIRRNVQISAQTKRLSLVAVLPLLAVVAKVILAIVNWRR